ncbi:hypothetical protein EJ903_20235 [Azospirillum griseum]|uniref:SprA-related family protein n=1 Tax=Azospirillum griseum TaxID=2496639 RepID=A0A431VCW0_9PROT|nr:hypothetical protein EJ903_20235 [Azospirillum griseum]
MGSPFGAYRSLAAGNQRVGAGGQADSTATATDGAGTSGAGASDGATTLSLSPQAQQQVQKLKQVDAEVRQHEAAHQAAGGGHAGAASFTFTRGPDGKSYATAGEVPIDISAESTPSATIAKMEQVKAAALAPSEPSPQDQRVAAQADALSAKAQAELRQQGGTSGDGAGDGNGSTVESANQTGASTRTSTANRSSDPSNRDGALSALSARGAAAYGNAQGLVGSAFGASRGASFVV